MGERELGFEPGRGSFIALFLRKDAPRRTGGSTPHV
jgi:hypothetical protein